MRPSTLLLILALIGLVLVFRHRRRSGLTCLTLALGAFAVIAVLPIGDLMMAPLEDRFPQVTTPPAHVDGIIVLGGAVDTELSAARNEASLNADAGRMTQFLVLARRYPAAKLAFTGGNGRLVHGQTSEAEVAARFFTELGLDPSRITYEGRSRTTYENAVFLKAMLNPTPDQRWLLVTSAWHMPRSVGLFRRAGWSVIPYPVGYKTAPELTTAIEGSLPERLALVDLAAHEWVGLTAYWLLGRTDALFPSPQGATPK
ncbi:YdcF family protein [Acidisoma cladoniae]|uniref:YdcF family protein n=1 Tax=Acidisoma cladoniae TaxID=3040935 RepID=UPI00254C82C4|nr:ElyC/SanA/YdcF family protein [Acidisoma sp. PAMC 29798]